MARPDKDLDPGDLYRMHVQQVGRWVLRLGGPAIDVEDTVHEVFAIACGRLSSFRGDSSVATWLFGITDKVVRNRRRKERWRRWLSGSPDETAGQIPTDTLDPLGVFEREQTARSVYRVLDRLPDGYRRILVLFELEDLRAEQVGQLLGISAAHARVRLHRARAKFMRVYQREFPAPKAEPRGERCRNVCR